MNYVTHENGLREWPTLYKKASSGKEQQWELAVVPTPHLDGVVAGTVRVRHGQVGGKVQTASVVVSSGKNLGKSNETTPLDQAVAEADAKWLKQQDKGYSTERGGASLELKPMLAHSYEDVRDKVEFPAHVQPKLDGVRAIAHKHDGVVDLWSRQGKKHAGLEHVRAALSLIMDDGDVFDGELYVHGMTFQTLVSLVKRDREESKAVQYHVYDMVSDRPFDKRITFAATKVLRANADASLGGLSCVRVVPTENAQCHEDVEAYHSRYVEEGYEGAMLRVGDCTYTQGYRSRQLLKVKAFKEMEFRIIDVTPGVGKMADQAVFVCETTAGIRFRVKPRGRDELRRRYLAEKERVVGKDLTVTYFSMTDGVRPVPRFPVGKCVRDYE